jgi:hypothetical protein
MVCPYLEELAMLVCRAAPIKKPLPRNRVAVTSPCLGEGFDRCPFFQERRPADGKPVAGGRECPHAATS